MKSNVLETPVPVQGFRVWEPKKIISEFVRLRGAFADEKWDAQFFFSTVLKRNQPQTIASLK